jgi:hypothetical protein
MSHLGIFLSFLFGSWFLIVLQPSTWNWKIDILEGGRERNKTYLLCSSTFASAVSVWCVPTSSNSNSRSSPEGDISYSSFNWPVCECVCVWDPYVCIHLSFFLSCVSISFFSFCTTTTTTRKTRSAGKDTKNWNKSNRLLLLLLLLIYTLLVTSCTIYSCASRKRI